MGYSQNQTNNKKVTFHEMYDKYLMQQQNE